MTLTKKEYDALGEAEYMIDDALVVAAPITFGGFCEKYDFDSKEYDFDFDGYDVEISIVAENPRHIFFLVTYLKLFLLKVITDANEIF